MKNISHLLMIFVFVLLLSAVSCNPFAGKSIATSVLTATPIPIVTSAPTAASTAITTATPAPTATTAATLQPGDSERSLTIDDLERSYRLHIPPGLDGLRPVSVVFFFHGYGYAMQAGDPPILGFNNLADRNGFLVVYPIGYAISWNASLCCGDAVKNNIDDIAFVRQMLSDLETIANIDPKRIYATGISNGAMFSYRLACEMSDTFAAIAPVAGALLYSPCQPQQPVSVMHIHGLSDPVVPYAGGSTSVLPNGKFLPVEQTITTWARLDGCTGSAKIDRQGIITHSVYAPCRAGSSVELYTIEGEGHDWPSENVFPITETILEFFATHPKQ